MIQYVLRLSIQFTVIFVLTSCIKSDKYINWDAYLGSKTSLQYSKANQITRENVKSLEVAWEYHAGDASSKGRSQIQCNPLVIDGVLYASSPIMNFFALDATTGKEIWKFDPFAADSSTNRTGLGVNRGLAFWEEGDDRRLLAASGNLLFCLNPATGKPIRSFGDSGKINLKRDLGRNVDDRLITANTPGVIYKDHYILGARVDESGGAAPGHIRAFNIITGELDWIFHTIPYPGEYGHDTWPEDAWQTIGGANSWAGMSLDEERGIVYVPTGSASYDFYGTDREGQNLFANCVIALNADTGERIWHYQTTHHDIWDRDLPAPPVLASIMVDGVERDVVMQTSKQGYVYVLDRDTGEPVFPIEEIPVPQDALPGEHPWPTQPIPVKPPPFTRLHFGLDDATNLSEESNKYVVDILVKIRYQHEYDPPSMEGTLIFPGYDGGAEWGGAAFNPDNNVLFINANHVPWILTMVEVEINKQTNIGRGMALYKSHCVGCHGLDLKGGEFMGNVPSLVDLKSRISEDDFSKVVRNGRNAMISFAWLDEVQMSDLKSYLFEKEAVVYPTDPESKVISYRGTGYNKFYDPEGYLAIKPPWGTLTAMDMDKAEIKWQVVLGEHKALTERGIPLTGTQNYGGPAITENGLLFIASTSDEQIRCFDQETGDVLWQADLPAAGYATPSIYMVDGKQFIVIACGGGKLGTKSGDSYVAFTLPENLK
ncbi:MAG: PQQ-binding-like beta-propeller repeat protein [Bacteroidota bacterium]